jgi:phage gpG-like protein
VLTFDWTPGLAAVSAALFELSVDIRSVKEPLLRSVREVMAPSLRTNFEVGGRPTWEPDTEQTWERKQGGSVLVETGALEGKAGQIGVWRIDGQAGEASLSGDSFPEYGVIHQNGWRFGPARPWAVMQDEDQDAIADVFDKWVGERIAKAGFI